MQRGDLEYVRSACCSIYRHEYIETARHTLWLLYVSIMSSLILRECISDVVHLTWYSSWACTVTTSCSVLCRASSLTRTHMMLVHHDACNDMHVDMCAPFHCRLKLHGCWCITCSWGGSWNLNDTLSKCLSGRTAALSSQTTYFHKCYDEIYNNKPKSNSRYSVTKFLR